MVTSEQQSKPLSVRFSAYEINFASRELFKHGTRLRIQKQPFEILCLLLERPGEVVSREELRSRLWPNNTFVEYEDSLNTAVRKLRAVLSDSSDLPRYVETVPGRGYRFIAEVLRPEESRIAESELNQSGATSDSQASPNMRAFESELREANRPLTFFGQRFRPRYLYASIILVIALAGSLIWNRSHRGEPTQAKVMLAVLPFLDLTGSANGDYFADGLTEEMITQMGHLDPQHLGVIASTSVMHYKGDQKLEKISRELGVQYAVQGSVRRDVNSVHVTARLIRTKDQTQVWARQYDRELAALLGLQSEIAHEIADEIHLTLSDHKLTSRSPATMPRNYEAYDLYLKGQYFLNKRSVAGFDEAIRYFEQAVAKDPNYAPAYAGLADAYALMSGYSARPQIEFMPKARAAALKALDLDASMAEAHTALALIVQTYDWDWQTAEHEFRRAIELNPNYATAHHWYAEHLMWRGRFDEALQESEQARQLDPLSLIIAADNGAILYYSRHYDRAIKKWRSVQEMDPQFPRAHLILAAYTEKQMFAEALMDLDQTRRIMPPAWYWANAASVYGRSGQSARAQQALHQLVQLNKDGNVDPMTLAEAYAGMKDREKAITWLEKAYKQHSPELVDLKVDPIYDEIRGDPRFEDLQRRVGLAQ